MEMSEPARPPEALSAQTVSGVEDRSRRRIGDSSANRPGRDEPAGVSTMRPCVCLCLSHIVPAWWPATNPHRQLMLHVSFGTEGGPGAASERPN